MEPSKHEPGVQAQVRMKFWQREHKGKDTNCALGKTSLMKQTSPGLIPSFLAGFYMPGQTHCITQVVKMKQRTALVILSGWFQRFKAILHYRLMYSEEDMSYEVKKWTFMALE